jgi:hypothetical protein
MGCLLERRLGPPVLGGAFRFWRPQKGGPLQLGPLDALVSRRRPSWIVRIEGGRR